VTSENNRSIKWHSDRCTVASFDRSCKAETEIFEPDRYSFWDEGRMTGRYAISRGAGLSYVAASFARSGVTVEHKHFNRLLAFDSSTNVLEVEAGVRLGQVYDFAIRRGLFLAVQPGHPDITVGGCIAADVHGKNQFKDGTFLSQVESIRLFHPKHGTLSLSREQDPDLFRLTCGGYGLTGNILTARLRLERVRGNQIELKVLPLESIFNLPLTLANAAGSSDLVYTWHDFTAPGRRFGKGFIVTGSFVGNSESLNATSSFGPPKPIDSIFSYLPLSLWNRLTVPPFNRIYGTLARLINNDSRVSVYDSLFPVANKVLYFGLFGKAGFHEYQVVIPTPQFTACVERIQEYVQRHRVPVSLATAKLFRGERELLRFTGNGICFALNFPRHAGSDSFLGFLDGLMLEYGGWPNLIKDSRLSTEFVAGTYPEYGLFRCKLREFDPERRYRSELSDRLDL
jgi:decaprenylphospho-beta-D-ribofuranose 2-oxidase